MIAFLDFVELVIAGILLLAFGTQIFYPLWRGTLLFPMWRREHKLWDKLSSERQSTVEADIEKQIQKEKKRRI